MAEDLVTVRWAYRPDDRSKQGKTEKLPRDLAALKVREGLAVLVETPPADSTDSADSAASTGAQDVQPASAETASKPARAPRASSVAGVETTS